jgi:hypothetical protein
MKIGDVTGRAHFLNSCKLEAVSQLKQLATLLSQSLYFGLLSLTGVSNLVKSPNRNMEEQHSHMAISPFSQE